MSVYFHAAHRHTGIKDLKTLLIDPHRDERELAVVLRADAHWPDHFERLEFKYLFEATEKAGPNVAEHLLEGTEERSIVRGA